MLRVGNTAAVQLKLSLLMFFLVIPITKFIILHFFSPGKALKKKGKIKPYLTLYTNKAAKKYNSA